MPQSRWTYFMCLCTIFAGLGIEVNGLNAQTDSLNTLRKKRLIANSSVFEIDSFAFAPNSVTVILDGERLNSQLYTVRGDSIVFEEDFIAGHRLDTLMVEYRILDQTLSKIHALVDTSQIQRAEDRAIYIGYDFGGNIRNANREIFVSPGLQYSGSFTRGFSIGNSQSLVLNSNFNMQLSGDLGDGLSIQAAISDENLPIQPQGTTQLLQEFDQVYIKVNKNNTSITAGDFHLEKPPGYFMNYYKKLKGLRLDHSYRETDDHLIFGAASFAVSRGKFARNNLEVQEGNQGPYKLRGNNGERILVVLSGTEKVYMDGRLLTRGLDHDYVIFYDQSEIIFTPNILITKDKRIIVEFEYADQNYLRTQIAGVGGMEGKNYKLNFNVYSEQDSKSTTGDIDLDSTDIAVLMEAGDDLSAAVRSGIRDIQSSAIDFQATYAKQFEPSISDSILVYSTDRSQKLYSASFSEVGRGSGSYEIAPEIPANGRAYKWVGPGKGKFEPIVQLVPPETRQMVSINGNYEFNSGLQLNGEIALSQFDVNRYSALDNDNNAGIAWLMDIEKKFNFGTKETPTQVAIAGHIDYVHRDFQALNPFRETEFTRNWNLEKESLADEWQGQITFLVKNNQLGQIDYGYQRFTQEVFYQGQKHNWNYNFSKKGLKIQSRNSLLTNSGTTGSGHFFRPDFRLEKSFRKLENWTVGGYYQMERNKQRIVDSGSLTGNSFQFHYWQFYLKSSEEKDFGVRIGANKRIDKLPDGDMLARSSTADELEFGGKWNLTTSEMRWNFIYRNLKIDNENLANTVPRSSFLGNFNYNFQAMGGAIRSSSSYQLGTGQEAKREFEFVEVRKGEGQYIWLDDGDEIQQLGEFKLAPVQDTANYVKVNIINNEFVKIQTKSLNQSIRLDGRKFINTPRPDQSGLEQFISRVSTVSSWRINQKLEDSGDLGNLSPISFNFEDTSLVSYLSSSIHTLFFNRGNPAYDIQCGIRTNKSRISQITGFEELVNRERYLRFRFNFNRGLDALANMEHGSRISDSEQFDQNDFHIDFLKISPEFNFRPTNKVRFILKYEWQDKKNQLESAESATSHEFRLESTFRTLDRSLLNAGFSFVKVRSDAQPNTSTELALLEGLKNGNNLLLNISFTRRISSFIDMIIGYDGRKTGSSRYIHTARAQIKASF